MEGDYGGPAGSGLRESGVGGRRWNIFTAETRRHGEEEGSKEQGRQGQGSEKQGSRKIQAGKAQKRRPRASREIAYADHGSDSDVSGCIRGWPQYARD